mmetsp:Transcript_8721/g.25077  ORF Transcript_8721/g.25077 Transcript_8721/m.25077 type:complete len:285 (+) Transcript_8721:208-1062(+)
MMLTTEWNRWIERIDRWALIDSLPHRSFVQSVIQLSHRIKSRLILVVKFVRQPRSDVRIDDVAHGAVKGLQDVPLRSVVIHQRRRDFVVGLEAAADAIRLVVVALHQRLAGYVIKTMNFRWVVRVGVGAAGWLVDPSVRNALHDGVGGHDEVDDHVDVDQLVQPLGLVHGAREAVQQQRLALLVAVHLLHDQVEDQAVRHQRPAVHVLLGLPAQRRALLDVLAQHVAGAQVLELRKVLQDLLGDGALAAAGLAQDQREHALLLWLGHGHGGQVELLQLAGRCCC